VDYFIPDIYAEGDYMICSQIIGMRIDHMGGTDDLRLGDCVHIEESEHPYQLVAFLGEIADMDEGRPVIPLIAAFAHEGTFVHYALEELETMLVTRR
jgi:hypothetical protein